MQLDDLGPLLQEARAKYAAALEANDPAVGSLQALAGCIERVIKKRYDVDRRFTGPTWDRMRTQTPGRYLS